MTLHTRMHDHGHVTQFTHELLACEQQSELGCELEANLQKMHQSNGKLFWVIQQFSLSQF